MIHLIINQASHTHGINKEEGLVGMIHTGNPLFVIKDCMDGNKEAIYHVNLVYLLDDVFTKNNIKYLRTSGALSANGSLTLSKKVSRPGSRMIVFERFLMPSKRRMRKVKIPTSTHWWSWPGRSKN